MHHKGRIGIFIHSSREPVQHSLFSKCIYRKTNLARSILADEAFIKIRLRCNIVREYGQKRDLLSYKAILTSREKRIEMIMMMATIYIIQLISFMLVMKY